MAPTRAPDPRLRRLAGTLSPTWLAGQRWFRGKSRPLRRVELRDATPLPGAPAWLLVLTATDSTGAHSEYLVPAIAEADAFREPRDDEGVWQQLAGLISAGGELGGAAGRFEFAPAPGFNTLLRGGAAVVATLGERRLRVEQSNTSVTLGDRLILKIYRLLEPGVNPEVEVCAFLDSVGFGHVPALGGAATYCPDGGEPSTAALLQELVPSQGDGWDWALDCLSGPPAGQEAALAGIARIGALTAELHAALASRPADPDFPSRLATSTELASWRSAAERQLEGALAAVDGEALGRLRSVGPRIRTHLAGIESAHGARVTRIHGDYHLGQLLRTAIGFTVIDFEGEPARPLAERRAPASPLRDVAGMLRSLEYVAQVAHHDRGSPVIPEAWLPGARAAFLTAYGGLDPADELLCSAFEIEKACYEVRYEADNRPAWVWLPLASLERLLTATAP